MQIGNKMGYPVKLAVPDSPLFIARFILDRLF